MLRLANLSMPPDYTEDSLRAAVVKKCVVPADHLLSLLHRDMGQAGTAFHHIPGRIDPRGCGLPIGIDQDAAVFAGFKQGTAGARKLRYPADRTQDRFVRIDREG